MTYLTNHYKNLCEQYKNKISILENLLNEDAPASTFSGTGKGQQTFSDQQLRDQMKQNRRTGAFGAEVADDKQNQAFKDAQAELARREGKGAVNLVNTSKPGESPRVDLDPSIKQSSDVKNDRVAGDWVERWANKLGEDPRKIEAMRRGVIDTLGGDAGKPMDTAMTSDQVAQRGVDAYNKAKEYVVGLQNQAKEAAAAASKPSATPEVTPTPSSKPSDTPEDTLTPLGALLKSLSSKPSATPEVTPKATPEPTTTPTSNPEPTITATSNPEQRTIPNNIRIPGFSLVSNSTSNSDNLHTTPPSGSIAAKPSNGSILDQKPDITVPEESSKKPTQSSNNFVQDLLQPFKDYTDQQSAQTKQSANNFVQDLLQPFKDYTDQQSAQTIQGAQNLLEPVTTYANELNAQEKINNIIKKLGNPRRVKIRRGMKKK